MKNSLSNKHRLSNDTLISVFVISSILGLVCGSPAQATRKNNPFSPSPEASSGKIGSFADARKPSNIDAPINTQGQAATNRRAVDPDTFQVENEREASSTLLSEIYRVGIGDVLFVDLKNSPHGSRNCTVRSDGTIDFPLAGDDLKVANKTVHNIEQMLISGVNLYSKPEIEVTVREYASHKIIVSGLVENPGEKSLRREAVPLFVILAETVVDPKATRVIIRRSPIKKLETYDLRLSGTDNVLISPGDVIEFALD